MPIIRPSNRWRYSSQKIFLKSAISIQKLSFWNSDEAWYAVNSFVQSESFNGGIHPVIGLQSTIESPDSVSLVIPPNRIIKNISMQQAINQSRIKRIGGLERLYSIRFFVIGSLYDLKGENKSFMFKLF